MCWLCAGCCSVDVLLYKLKNTIKGASSWSILYIHMCMFGAAVGGEPKSNEYFSNLPHQSTRAKYSNYYIILYYIILYYIILYYIILYYIYYTILYYTILYYIVLYYIN